jgi:hypothetical protein
VVLVSQERGKRAPLSNRAPHSQSIEPSSPTAGGLRIADHPHCSILETLRLALLSIPRRLRPSAPAHYV